MRLSTFLRTTVLSVLLLSATFCYADIKLPALVGSNMVLQRNKPLHIWGWADKGEAVAVTFKGKTFKTVATEKGKWQVTLPAMPAGGPYEMSLKGKNTIQLDNILIGEVWIASGQSNMEMPLQGWGKVHNNEQEVKAANYPNIRLMMLKRTTSTVPLEDAAIWEGGWQACTPQSVHEFSAVGYFFAREINGYEQVPVGIILTSWGGTVAEAWTSGESLKKMPAFADSVKKFEQLSTPETPANPNKVTLLYNAMIHPVIPYTIRGVIWYQGESNAGRAYQYRELFPLMIKDWRKQWKQGDFPFYFVQLANYKDVDAQPVESDWAELREAQTKTLALPATGMASAIDIGDAKDIHPKNKQEVGHRLALIARAQVYGEKVAYSGPMYVSKQVAGNKVLLNFKNTNDGLQAKKSGSLKGFAIAGEDKKFHWAQATIKGNQVVVWSEEVAHPVAVRYDWANNPEGNLYNGAGLPAGPFRTDDWKGVTFGKE